MLYFHFNGLKNLPLYTNIANLARTKADIFKEKVLFVDLQCSFPYTFWNGDINNNNGELLLRPQLENFVNNNNIFSCTLDFSNLKLTQQDLKDHRLNTVLEICNTGSNNILVSDFEIAESLKEKYPEYSYILSDRICWLKEYTVEELNAILDSGLFKLVQLPANLSDNFEFINQIDHKNMLTIPIDKRTLKCSKFMECGLAEQSLQYNFYKSSKILDCKKCKVFNMTTLDQDFISFDSIVTDYMSKGIKHYLLPPILDSIPDTMRFMLFFIDYFIKDEYKDLAKQLLII